MRRASRTSMVGELAAGQRAWNRGRGQVQGDGRGAECWMSEGGGGGLKGLGVQRQEGTAAQGGEGVLQQEWRGQKPDLRVTHRREGDTRKEGDHRRRPITPHRNRAPCFFSNTNVLGGREDPSPRWGSNQGQEAVPPPWSLFPSASASPSSLQSWERNACEKT